MPFHPQSDIETNSNPPLDNSSRRPEEPLGGCSVQTPRCLHRYIHPDDARAAASLYLRHQRQLLFAGPAPPSFGMYQDLDTASAVTLSALVSYSHYHNQTGPQAKRPTAGRSQTPQGIPHSTFAPDHGGNPEQNQAQRLGVDMAIDPNPALARQRDRSITILQTPAAAPRARPDATIVTVRRGPPCVETHDRGRLLHRCK
jgi:hypothetical protein